MVAKTKELKKALCGCMRVYAKRELFRQFGKPVLPCQRLSFQRILGSLGTNQRMGRVEVLVDD